MSLPEGLGLLFAAICAAEALRNLIVVSWKRPSRRRQPKRKV